MSKAVARLVNTTPAKTKPSDTASAVMGPLRAKSTKAALFDGKDRRGVIHPKKGRLETRDGIGTGGPIFIFFCLATR